MQYWAEEDDFLESYCHLGWDMGLSLYSGIKVGKHGMVTTWRCSTLEYLSAGKVCVSVFWNCQDILLLDFLGVMYVMSDLQSTWYCWHILDEVKLAFWRKQQDMLIQSVILLHDNYRWHTAALAWEKFGNILLGNTWTPILKPRFVPLWLPQLWVTQGRMLGGPNRKMPFCNDQDMKLFVHNRWWHAQFILQ